MKQLLQRLDTGETTIVDVPVPSASGPNLVVETRATVVSAGTERMLLEFGRSSLVGKARSQPDKVRQVIDKMRTDGIGPTIGAVRAKLEAPIPLGYCNAGIVVDTGERAGAFSVGDRVVSNGWHAEYVRVPYTIAAKIPESVDFEAASFTPLASIGLQGIRLAAPTLGETVVVFGLGLIGLLTVQLLRANGCRIIGIDPNPSRLRLGEQFGADVIDGSVSDVATRVLKRTGGAGADAVLLTLASKSDEPVHQAATMSRKRGRLVIVGVTGLNLAREDFYRKELFLAVSCSYGPGRYDPLYEEKGHDYPLPFVRWTEQRNFEAVLALMADSRIDPLPLITHRFAFDDASSAYDVIAGTEPSLAVVLTYGDVQKGAPAAARTIVRTTASSPVASPSTVGIIGAGNFALRTLLPLLKSSGVRFRSIASAGGTSAALAAQQFGCETVTTDLATVFEDEAIDTIYVLTRHHDHAKLALRALQAGKHVFVEKPLALNQHELEELNAAAMETNRLLTVGFNRRFAPLAEQAVELLRGRVGTLSLIVTVNAGFIPRDHWIQDPEVGGGRIVGEACHFIDLVRFMVGSPICGVHVTTARDGAGRTVEDIAHITLTFDDGSTAVVHYLANGAGSFPKETIEAFFDGKTFVIDNWRRLRRWGVGKWRPWRGRKMDKGHQAEVQAWLSAIATGGPAPISLEDLFEVSRWSIRAAELARS